MQKFLGHHSILTTARYTHLTDQTKHHAIERINGLMDGFTIAWGGSYDPVGLSHGNLRSGLPGTLPAQTHV